ncbi:MAG: helix-turn-helix domain-containing protein [Acidimicrobiales bacterium]
MTATDLHPEVVPAHESPRAWALRSLELRGLVVVRWTRTDRTPAPPGAPALYVVDDDVEPPACPSDQDWVRAGAAPDEIELRGRSLLDRVEDGARSQPEVDDDGVLRVGRHLVVLPPQEARLLRALLASPGRLVPRDALVAAVWPDGPGTVRTALDNRVKNLRRRLGDVPLRIHTLRGRGLLIELVDEG